MLFVEDGCIRTVSVTVGRRGLGSFRCGVEKLIPLFTSSVGWNLYDLRGHVDLFVSRLSSTRNITWPRK